MKKLTALLMLISALASADPGTASRYLMNEPATLFELGFMRAEKWMDSQPFGEQYFHISGMQANDVWTYAVYQYSDDLYIFGVGFSDDKSTVSDMENTCKEILRRHAIVFKMNVMQWFSHHADGGSGRAPDDFFEMLRSRTRIECRVTRAIGEPNVFFVSMDLKTEKLSVITEAENN